MNGKSTTQRNNTITKKKSVPRTMPKKKGRSGIIHLSLTPHMQQRLLFVTEHLIIGLLLLWQYGIRGLKWLFFGASISSPYSGRFMTRLEERNLLRTSHTGIIVDGKRKLNLDLSYRHLLLTGATGAGKSSTIFIPMILGLEHSAVILDCSGSLFDQTSGHLKKQKFRILRLNFSDPLHSECYNVLARADTHSKMKRVATTLVDVALGGGNSKDSFWNLSAGNVLYCIIRTLKTTQKVEYQNLANVRHILNNLSSKKESAGFQWMMAESDDATFEEFKGCMAASEKVVDSVLANCRTALEKIADPDLARMTASDTLGDIRNIRKRKTVLYLTVKETEISYLNFLIAVVLGDLLDMAMEMPKPKELPLFFCLDEFSHFKVKDFSTILTTLRKRRVSCVMGVQSKSMLRHQYSAADAESIVSGGCASHLILPGQNNPRENNELSNLLGDNMVDYQKGQIVRPILTPDEIYALKGKGIFLHSGCRPALVKLHPFYKNKTLLEQSKIKPVSYKRKKTAEVKLVSLKV